MLLLSGGKASVVFNTNERSRPIITGGPLKTLTTDTGQIIRSGASVPIGANTTSAVFQNSTWAACRTLGFNTLRVSVISSALTLSQNTLLSNIDLVVELARANRMYMMLGYFVVSPGSYGSDIATNQPMWTSFWNAAAPRWKDKPWVFYEPFNEPWQWGQVSSCTPEIQQSLKVVYDTIRAGAPDTVIAWPSAANLSPSAAQYATLLQGMDARGNGVPVDWSKTVLSYHYYNQTQQLTVSGGLNNATDGGEAGLRALGATYPLLNTETNWYVEAPRLSLIDGLDLYERMGLAWTLLRYAGQVSPVYSHDYDNNTSTPDTLAPLGPDYADKKIAQLRSRGFVIPVEGPATAELFSATSPWNVPVVGSVDPNSNTLVSDVSATGSLAKAISTYGPIGISGVDTAPQGEYYSVPFYEADASTPRVAVGHSTDWWAGFPSVPIPTGATASLGDDHHLAVWDKPNNLLYEFWGAVNTGGNWSAGFGVTFASNGLGYQTGTGLNSARAYGGSLVGGLIRRSEMLAGVIPHALAMAYPLTRGQFYARGLGADGVAVNIASHCDNNASANRNTASNIPEGARLRLKASVDIDARCGSDAACKIIGQALKTYGVFIVDTAGANGIYAEVLSVHGQSWAGIMTRTAPGPFVASDFELMSLPASLTPG